MIYWIFRYIDIHWQCSYVAIHWQNRCILYTIILGIYYERFCVSHIRCSGCTFLELLFGVRFTM